MFLDVNTTYDQNRLSITSLEALQIPYLSSKRVININPLNMCDFF